MKSVMAVFAFILAALPVSAVCADTAHFDITSADLATLEKTIQQAPVVFLIVSESRMPAPDTIAHYVPALNSDAGRPTIWIAESHSRMLDSTYNPMPSEHTALFIALILLGMDVSPAGSKWHTLYVDLQRAGHLDVASKLVPQLDQDGFTFHPGNAAGNPELQELMTAVAREMAPGVEGIAAIKKPASTLPAYDPLAHYAGWNVSPEYPNQGFIAVNKEYVATHGGSVTSDSQMLQAYLEAFVLATCDSGHAGSTWKQRYETAAAADAALPTNVADRYQNRHAFALPIAQQLKAIMVFR